MIITVVTWSHSGILLDHSPSQAMVTTTARASQQGHNADWVQGVPTLAQEAVPAGSVARFVGVLVRLRARLAPLLTPDVFTSPRQITWHGAAAGAC